MPFLRCSLSPCSGLPKQSRFWDVVRVDPSPRILSLDPFRKERELLADLQQGGVIGSKASLENFCLEKGKNEEGWRLLYVVGKRPTVLMEIRPPSDRQFDLFS